MRSLPNPTKTHKEKKMTDGARVDGDFAAFYPNGGTMSEFKQGCNDDCVESQVPVEQRPIKSLARDLKRCVEEAEMSPDDKVIIAVVDECDDPTDHKAMLKKAEIYTGIRVGGVGNVNEDGTLDKYMILFVFKEKPTDED
jgi:hypothetical protein